MELTPGSRLDHFEILNVELHVLGEPEPHDGCTTRANLGDHPGGYNQP